MNDAVPEDEGQKSKSQIKREMQALRDLGVELITLPPSRLEQLPLSPQLQEAVIAARGFKKEALRRQVQHIGGLLREEDAEAIRQALQALRQPHRKEVQAFHEVEQWRDRLLAGDDACLEEVVTRFDQVDRQHLRQLVRNARKEQERGSAPKSARSLFRYLAELQASEG